MIFYKKNMRVKTWLWQILLDFDRLCLILTFPVWFWLGLVLAIKSGGEKMTQQSWGYASIYLSIYLSIYSILFCSVLLYSILSIYSILFYSILFYLSIYFPITCNPVSWSMFSQCSKPDPWLEAYNRKNNVWHPIWYHWLFILYLCVYVPIYLSI